MTSYIEKHSNGFTLIGDNGRIRYCDKDSTLFENGYLGWTFNNGVIERVVRFDEDGVCVNASNPDDSWLLPR